MAVAHIDTAMPDLTPVRIHVIDTPGGPDYVGQALSALDAVKSVAVVVDATKGIELMTRRMMQWAEERGLCRVIVVNKIDAPDVNLHELLDELKEAFGDGVLPINLPTKGCTRVIDCFDKDSGESDIMTVSDVHRAFIERVVEVDDETMEKYLEEGDVDPSTLHGPVTKALREAHVIPVCFTSAKNLIGIRDFMKVIIRHLPSPSEANDAQFIDKEGAPYQTQPDKTLPVVAHVFKVVSDPFVGKIGVFRVHQGCITAGSTLYVNDNKKPIKAARPLILQGKNTFETDELHPGDIGALNKIDELTYGCILHSDPNLDIRMRPLPFPKPMLGLAIAPARRGDEGRMSEVLGKMLAEDPTLSVDHDVVLNETVLRGLTEMHVRTVLERMKEQFKLEVTTKTPSVPYRETISGSAEGHARHKKQTGGAGQFGEVHLIVEPYKEGMPVPDTYKFNGQEFKINVKGTEEVPLEWGGKLVFINSIVGGSIDARFLPAILKGIMARMEQGPLTGSYARDVRVIVYDGKMHPVDSNEISFMLAGRNAFSEAFKNAGPKILEPIYDVEVFVPSDKMGDVMGDLQGRRAMIMGMSSEKGFEKLVAKVPLKEMSSYSTALSSLTGGRASFIMKFSSYELVPTDVQDKLIKDFEAKQTEE